MVVSTTLRPRSRSKRRCEAEEHADVVSVARGLRIPLTSNAAAIAKAEAAIKRMDVLVDQAKQAGLMSCLNAGYRAREDESACRRSFVPTL